MKGRLGWIVAILFALGIAYAKWGGGTGDDLRQAAADNKVTIAITADRPGRAHITVTRARAGSGALHFVLPIGTVLAAADDHSQRLMTAARLEIYVAADQPSVELDVETYCLDQFKPPPLEASPLTLAVPGPDGTSEATEDDKLAACLADSGATLHRRQVALWLVKGRYLDKSYDDATSDATRQFEDELSRELQDKMNSEFAARLRQADPGIGEAEIRRQIARFTPDKLRARVHDKAVSLTRAAFGHARADAFALLEKCGDNAATALFFHTAPDG